MAIDWPALTEILRNHQRFLLTSHIRPDCDALGSELGLAAVLDELGKDVRIANGQETPPNLAFIDPENRIEVINENVTLDDLQDREIMIILDTSAWAQLGPMGDVIRGIGARKLIIDHHVSEDDLGAEPFKNTTAEATGRLIVELAEQLGVELTPRSATPLYAAIATDTGWFRFPATSDITYQCGAKLLLGGAKPADIYNALYEQDTVGRVRLRGVILSRVQTELDGQLAHTYVLKEDFESTGALPSDTEDAINLTLGIAGVMAAVILVEQADGGFKLSFRSRCDMDCSEVAETFGGGGHKAAAGAFVLGTLEEVQPRVLDVVRAAVR